jgi:polar amino acid transport system permease protein
MDYDFSFDLIWGNIGVLFTGLLTTLQITGISMVLGLFWGIFIAIFRLSRHFTVSKAAAAYVEFFRCTPVLVQLVWVFYCLPILLGIELSNYVSSVIALTLYVGAIYAEAFRSGIQGIEQDQIDATIALGLSPAQRMRYIILPQAVRIVIPVLLSNSVSLFKESSLVSTVGMSDLMYNGRILSASTYRPIEILTTVAVIYFIVAFPATLVTRRLEVTLAKKLER